MIKANPEPQKRK